MKKKSNSSTFIHFLITWMEAETCFGWSRALDGTFKALQKKFFPKKCFELHAWQKECYFGKFSERTGIVMPFQCGPQKTHNRTSAHNRNLRVVCVFHILCIVQTRRDIIFFHSFITFTCLALLTRRAILGKQKLGPYIDR